MVCMLRTIVSVVACSATYVAPPVQRRKTFYNVIATRSLRLHACAFGVNKQAQHTSDGNVVAYEAIKAESALHTQRAAGSPTADGFKRRKPKMTTFEKEFRG